MTFFFIIFDFNYFNAIQAAIFYTKNAFEMFNPSFFMFWGLMVFCDQNQKWSLEKNNYWKMSSKIG